MTDWTRDLTRIVDSSRMQEIDRRAQNEYAIPAIVLMESAGLLSWLEIERRLSGRPQSPRLCVVAGKGNNGGDALVMARYAVGAGYETSVVLSAPEEALGEHARVHAGVVRSLGVQPFVWANDRRTCLDALARADVVVDGLAGTGVRGALRAPLDDICSAINEALERGAQVASVDAPSGLGDEWRPGMPAVRATWTLTMGLPKECLYAPAARSLCGAIVRINVCFPSDLTRDPTIRGTLLESDRLRTVLPPLDADTYKHRRGATGVFAGGVGTTGAAVLSAEGAHRCRAGLVTVFADDAIYPIVASNVGSVMVRPLDPEEPLAGVDVDSVVIGPGWGVSDARRELLRALLPGGRADRVAAGVLDADALNLLAGMDDAPGLHDRWVLTPHPGELGRLLGTGSAAVLADFKGAALELAGRTGAVVVGKSHTTIVAHPDGRFAYADGMNAAMGTGGSGDVLAGAIGGLLAGGMDGWRASCAAVLVHQIAGRSLRRRRGLFLAEELAAELGKVADVRSKPRA
ncbi:MAG: NAD(P)H-hydrate dehydratase [Spirochaetales bacterium]